MKLEFTTTLKGDDIIIEYPLKENQTILSKECTIKWHICPQIESWGIRYWRAIMDTFMCTITIQTIGEENPEKIIIDGLKYYEMVIDEGNYKMADDYCITKIDINYKDHKAIGGVQWTA